MARKYYDYSVLTTGATFTDGETTKPLLIGASAAVVTNGVLTVINDGPSGVLGKSLGGTTQGVSGTTYIWETITATGVLSVSIYWKMPSSVGTIGASLFRCDSGAGATNVSAMSLLSTEQIRIFSQSGGTLFTSTYSGGFTAGNWYRTDIQIEIGTTTSNGRVKTATYLEHGTTALTNTTYDSGYAVNTGTANITRVKHGPRASTGTADENVRVRMGYDPASAYLMGPQLADDPPVLPTSPDQGFFVYVDLSDTDVPVGPIAYSASPSTDVVAMPDGIFLPAEPDGSTTSYVITATDTGTGQTDTLAIDIALPVSTQDVIETVVWNGAAWV